MNLSLVILTRNSEKIFQENLEKIGNYLKNLEILSHYEIIVSDFSEDKTFEILTKIARENKLLIPVKAPRKGIGCGIKSGFDVAKFENVMFYPIDMAWEVNIIEESLEKLKQNFDVVLGSRWIYGSQTERPIKREIFSKFYNILISLLFNLKIRDTQGTVAIKRNDFLKYRKKLEYDGPFLQTEILIYSKKLNLKIIEIPSNVLDKRKNSSIKLWSFGFEMAINAIKKRFST